ncbi:MAG: hypothetical protein US54_C0030G0015 [Candidatus Roizmanbacteria bacterium GW2011_GWA2_37_7]|uniref:Uncharacterized protein n=1 Tax=Candidatus Roizmanbacteria bacterium GW2011_GWA2_37_7 TaxID=1618481 RepID=A0A0G0H314_9BACT|nr:MAG: hypothetical protein US54_C0030G0015 [Candidatus Roizmanbacteria bacterium GW2011_GWA2_37_7]
MFQHTIGFHKSITISIFVAMVFAFMMVPLLSSVDIYAVTADQQTAGVDCNLGQINTDTLYNGAKDTLPSCTSISNEELGFGDKDAVTAAREKIQAAVVGMILIVAVLAIIWTLEQVIFNRRICLGLSCSLTLPGLIERTAGDYCCVCVNETSGNRGDIINTNKYKCNANGTLKAL